MDSKTWDSVDTHICFLQKTASIAKSAAAIAALREAMPGVEVVPVPAESIIIAGGALHCVMKSIPTARWPMPCDDPYAFNDDDPRCEGITADDDGGDDGGSDGETSSGSDDGSSGGSSGSCPAFRA